MKPVLPPQPPVYLDYNATCPVHPQVLEAMLPFFCDDFGNASSRTHPWGWRAAQAVDQARAQLAALLQAEAEQLIFTSGATEALNMAIKGLAASWRDKKKHLICWSTEHKAVLDCCKALRRDGFETTYLPVLPSGQPDMAAYRQALRPDTLLVCGMLANNETGVRFPIPELAALARANGSFFLCDATQAVGKIPVDIAALGVDMLVCSAHKFYGPKGVGALWMAKKAGLKPQPLLHGGGHEAGWRSGTLNVPGIVGMGAAAALAQAALSTTGSSMQALRDGFEAQLTANIPALRIIGRESPRLPNTSNLYFEACEAASIIKSLRNIALATGSACSSGSAQPSHVLLAMGLSEQEAGCCLRISIGAPTRAEELAACARQLAEVVAARRAEWPAWQIGGKAN